MEIITRKEAQEKGLPRYFTGKPCKHGHVCERQAVDGQCSECGKHKSKKMRIKHREKRLRYEAEYRQKNHHLVTQRAANWRQKNADAIKDYSKLYYASNLQSCAERRKKWYQQNRDYALLYRREHYQKNLQSSQASSRRWKQENKRRVSLYNSMKRQERDERLARATPIWADKNAIAVKYKERNAMTQMTGVQHHVDHGIPLKGENVCGLHIAENLRVILARDNLSKSNKWETN
jgi:hypothetical protein